MQRLLLPVAWILVAPLFADEPPRELGVRESAEVNLVLVDTVVLDADDRTVPGLTRDDFEVRFRGERMPIDTLDVACEAGALDDARAVRRADRREVVPAVDTRRIVVAFDYLHLGPQGRNNAFAKARELFLGEVASGDEVMLVALTGGVRIEQPFSSDPEQSLRTLRRMDHDITLWNGNFAHLTERGFVRGLSGLFDVLATVPGRKSVVLFSEMADVPLDLEFDKLSAAAAASRSAVYSVDVRGLVPADPRGVAAAPG